MSSCLLFQKPEAGFLGKMFKKKTNAHYKHALWGPNSIRVRGQLCLGAPRLRVGGSCARLVGTLLGQQGGGIFEAGGQRLEGCRSSEGSVACGRSPRKEGWAWGAGREATSPAMVSADLRRLCEGLSWDRAHFSCLEVAVRTGGGLTVASSSLLDRRRANPYETQRCPEWRALMFSVNVYSVPPTGRCYVLDSQR